MSLGQASGAIGARTGRLPSVLRQGRLVPHIARELSLSAAAEAHRGPEQRDNIDTYLLLP